MSFFIYYAAYVAAGAVKTAYLLGVLSVQIRGLAAATALLCMRGIDFSARRCIFYDMFGL
jgi:hypothetical protein